MRLTLSVGMLVGLAISAPARAGIANLLHAPCASPFMFDDESKDAAAVGVLLRGAGR